MRFPAPLRTALTLLALVVAAACSTEGVEGVVHDLPPVAADSDTVSDTVTDTDTAPDTVPDTTTVSDTATDSATATDPATDPDSVSCPPPPADLAAITLSGTGRLRDLGSMTAPGLLPRRVRVLLPAGYDDDPHRRYPVLYAHDGQNLLEDSEAAFGVAWQVDDTLDRLAAEGRIEPHVLVAIDNTSERIDDYTWAADPDWAMGGKGDLYADLLAQRIKPLVDSLVRTRCGREDTAVMGSSMGGLISMHIYLRHPDTFGRVASLSPSFWWRDSEMVQRFADWSGEDPHRLWVDGGTAESGVYGDGLTLHLIDNIRAVRDAAISRGAVLGRTLGFLEDPEAPHNEAAWRDRLDSVLESLLGLEDPADLEVTKLSAHLHEARLLSDAGLPPDRGSATTLSVEALHGGRVRLTWPNTGAELSTDPQGVAEINAAGLIVGKSGGQTTVKANVLGQRAIADLTVAPAVALHLRVQVPAGTPAADTVFIAASAPHLGTWDADGRPLKRGGDGVWELSVPIEAGVPLDYKITRGSWETVEKQADGSEQPNRSLTLDAEETVEFTVARWADSP